MITFRQLCRGVARWWVLALIVAAVASSVSPVAAQALDAPSSVTVTRGDGYLEASWPAVAGATRYHVTYSSDGGASWSLASSDHPTNSITITGVDNALAYVVGVRAGNADAWSVWTNSASAAPAQQEDRARIASDNDSDDDNLIEVTTVAQFIAMQWDLNGDGTPESEATKYNAAFTSGVSGCSSTCAGYEITADLTITANPTDAGTSYLVPGTWNTTFQGNGNTITNNDSRPLFENIGATTGSTTGEIKGLNVDNSGATNAILADKVQAQGKVTNTGVTGKVTVSGNSTRGGAGERADRRNHLRLTLLRRRGCQRRGDRGRHHDTVGRGRAGRLRDVRWAGAVVPCNRQRDLQERQRQLGQPGGAGTWADWWAGTREPSTPPTPGATSTPPRIADPMIPPGPSPEG